jgi:hypothetical protein
MLGHVGFLVDKMAAGLVFSDLIQQILISQTTPHALLILSTP